MSIKDFENVFTRKQMENISDNLRAYLINFGYIKIVKADYGGGFLVYTDEQRAEYGNYTQYCYNFDYLNGWLYGAVQAINGIMKPIKGFQVVTATINRHSSRERSRGYNSP